MQIIYFLNICIQGDQNSFLNDIIHLLSLSAGVRVEGKRREKRKEKDRDLAIYFSCFKLVLVVTLQHNSTLLRHFTIRLRLNVTYMCKCYVYLILFLFYYVFYYIISYWVKS